MVFSNTVAGECTPVEAIDMITLYPYMVLPLNFYLTKTKLISI